MANPANPILDAALSYHERGWSILPMKMAEKKPAVRWKRYQSEPARKRSVRRWFGDGKQHGIGVIFGEVSRQLGSRDFDAAEGYEQWATEFPDLAEVLPTVKTRRGFHVYFVASPRSIRNIREALGKPDLTGAIQCEDGELRAGGGCYSVLPPSMHPSGSVYEWAIPLPDGSLPEIDPHDCGLWGPTAMSVTESTERPRALHMRTEAIGGGSKSVGGESPDVEAAAEAAILGSLPLGPGQRHQQVFDLARALKAIPALADAPVNELKTYVRRWHELAQPVIRTQAFEETWIDFLKGWPRVMFPKGAEPMANIVERVLSLPLPAVAEQYEQDKLRSLVSLCRELQRATGDGPFYLACRTAGQLLDVDHNTANRWLYLLRDDRVLVEVKKGNAKSRKASRYRYVAAMD
ncbi:MAG: hypothetical protein CMJ62_02605 [Planctomycetaceae bacterium]|nr:hypothetical protein [Planctomycetaceae bacterium]